MKVAMMRASVVASVMLGLAACGGGGETAVPAAGETAPSAATAQGSPGTEAAPAAAAPVAAGGLLTSPSWMPADWDQKVFWGAEREGQQPAEDILKWRNQMVQTAPFTLWAVAHDTLVDEIFQPIWVWYTALRSCERGIQMTDDLAGEFGDRARGKAALTQARADLKAWAATQPPEITMNFTADLGQWNDVTGNFLMQNLSRATTLKPKDLEAIDPYYDGATVELWSDGKAGRQAINHFQASLLAPECVSKDGKMVYKFEKMSQWWVVFGDVDRGMGGLANYKSRELLPAITMTREAAAAFAQRNPQRKVEVAVTFGPVGTSFVKGTDQSAIRAKFKQVTVTDALDGTVLATQAY